MRYVKALILIAFFFFAMLFFVQNNQVLAQGLTLKLELFNHKWESMSFPFYLLVLLSFAAGAVVCTLYFLVDRIKHVGDIKSLKHQIKAREKELNGLRNMPLEEQSYPSSTSSEETAA